VSSVGSAEGSIWSLVEISGEGSSEDSMWENDFSEEEKLKENEMTTSEEEEEKEVNEDDDEWSCDGEIHSDEDTFCEDKIEYLM